jgi:hypothetical protein
MSRTYYQFYTNVTYRTCAECLGLHGKIEKDPQAFPSCPEGCERKVLPVPHKDLHYYKEQAHRMREVAQAELSRRSLFEQGKQLLGSDDEQAIELLAQSVRIDVYVPEVERLAREKEQTLKADGDLKDRLRQLFARAYFEKFGWPRYERLPERMRLAREKAGIERIKELLQ